MNLKAKTNYIAALRGMSDQREFFKDHTCPLARMKYKKEFLWFLNSARILRINALEKEWNGKRKHNG